MRLLKLSENLYPIEKKENLLIRFKIAQKIAKSVEAFQSFCALLVKDICSFFDLCLWTYDTRKETKTLPFILYDYQRELVEKINTQIEKGEDILIEKSRDMGVTWLVLGIFLYRWLFFKESFLVGSRKEELVDKLGDMDSLFERLRFMLKMLFPQLRPSNLEMSYLKISRPEGAVIAGESMNEGFSRQGRYNAILLDEFAHLHRSLSDSIWQACGDSTKCRIAVSTPKGKQNTFADLRFSEKILAESVLWSKHPEKTVEWYESEKKRRTELEIAQELDISYVASAGKPFYAGFKRDWHVGEFIANPHLELLLGVDYGYRKPACIISQLDEKGRWIIFDELMGEEMLAREFAEWIRRYLNLHYPDYSIKVFADPAGKQASDKSEKPSEAIVSEILGVSVRSKPSSYRERKEIIERLLKTLIEDKPSLLVDKKCQTIIEGFEGGYHYPESAPDALMEQPERDGYYEHLMNALEYIAVNIFSPVLERTDLDRFGRNLPRKAKVEYAVFKI